MNFLSSPIYVKEKYDHDKYCDQGLITRLSAFYNEHGLPDIRETACKYCERINRVKNKKQTNLQVQADG